MSARDSRFFPDFLNKPVTRRQVLGGAAVVGAGAALGPVAAACGGSSSSGSSSSASPTAAAGTPKMGGNLRVAAAAGSAKEDLDIHAPALTMPSMNMRFNMYDSLLEKSPEGVLGNALAEEVTPNATATEFTVKLKSGLTFHDGKSVTADDVVYSFQRIMDPKNPGLAAPQLLGLTPKGIKKVDDLTVTFVLDSANAIFPEALAAYSCGIVPTGYDPKGATGAIGTGPFKVTDFLPGQKGVFAKHEGYWRTDGGPYVDTLEIIEFADSTAQLNALLGGAADYCQMVSGAQRKVAESAGMALLEAKTGSWIPFTMRTDIKPFNDNKVRQAFRLIVDREQMIAQAADGMQWLGNDMYAPFDPGYPADLPQRMQDLEKAKSLLKEAGYEGLSVELTTSTSVSSGAPAAATVFAQQAKGAGVTVKVNNVNGDVFWGDEYLKYPFAMDNWGARGYLAQAGMGTMPKAFYNETHWDHPEWLAIVEEAYKTVDDAKRNELIAQASTIEYNEGGYIIYAFDKQVDAFSKKVAGAVPDVTGLGSAANNSRYRLVYFV
jgi:peptide/nickel transport system substrate-binding protein